ncbi:T9SS type A sorting domain-containing protein [Flavobacterium sp. GT3R68]|uniref:T9SS type A sorting domain-containing protein n=1 Tax=Flavobacterium sp. GT3R68 TaxID=2594437 RepID=UPI000F899DE7|nr:T9SS type A sorting domain-containing protein [Flavobacterium sp. GT3R68]RTY87271.1 T9SS type A sorting domain-containing protein [Flavobacterium sp. GSN2]TRW89421.1 T9SS type A sorting domain-containing protein [Flavobacterium sp. GT3R68]
MRKITFTILGLLFTASGLFAQTYSTGTVPFFGGGATTAYSGKIDVTAATVTLTLIGPSTSWLGMGFNTTGMGTVGRDVVIYDGINMTDRTFVGVGFEPPLDAIQNWTISSDVVNTGVRTVVATRARNTGDSNDYVFPAAAQPINVVYARRLGSMVVAYHESGNCGATTVNLALGTEDFALAKFKMYPNPTIGYTTIELPEGFTDAKVAVYDFLGRIVKKQSVSNAQNNIDITNLQKGSYLLKVSTEDGSAVKTLVVN